MTEAKTPCGRLRAAAALGAALALAGCTGANVGSDWQCPLAQGKACVSVAGADPAVAKPGPARTVAIREPLYEIRAAAAAERDAAGDGGHGCAGTCNPFSWLAGLFAADEPEAADEPPDGSVPDARPDVAAAPAASGPVAPADPAAQADPASGVGGLRTGEVIGRIWIAPFVDGAGVYREAGWVRVVIAPARWRLP